MKNTRKTIVVFASLPFLIPTAATLNAQMVSPAMDRPDQPFSYFSKSTDEIGVMDAEAATEITPEGYLRTGYGELMFFTGPELKPTSVRIRTLEDGHSPIVHYNFERDGVSYAFTMFAMTRDVQNGEPEGPLVSIYSSQSRLSGVCRLTQSILPSTMPPNQ